MSRAIDLTDHEYGSVKVLERAGTKGNHALWKCRCICGKVFETTSNSLRKGNTKSCGCQSSRKQFTTHGMRRTRVYKIWMGMKERCQRSKAVAYAQNGGRGIKVCDRWQKFELFYEDMGDPPSDQHTLDRKDNNGNYEKSNCRWATDTEQHNNRSDNCMLTYKGKTQSMMDWVRETGLPKSTIQKRLKRGWSVEKSLSEPVQETGRRCSR